LNYIYIFKKDEPLSTVTTDGKLILSKEDLREKLQELKEEDQSKANKKQKLANIAKGKELYNLTCQKCHGVNAKKEAYNSARPLANLTLDNMKQSIQDYTLGEKDNGNAILMSPYADRLQSEDIVDIYSYLQTLK